MLVFTVLDKMIYGWKTFGWKCSGGVVFHISVVSTDCLYMIQCVFTLKLRTDLSLHPATIWVLESMILTIGEMCCSQVLITSRVSMHKIPK